MEPVSQTKELADFFENSFRALKPGRLSASILALCRDIVTEPREETRPEERPEVAR